jgi:hypothetical protein
MTCIYAVSAIVLFFLAIWVIHEFRTAPYGCDECQGVIPHPDCPEPNRNKEPQS